MLTTRFLSVFKKLFSDQTYGHSLQKFIASRNPKCPADIEILERQWQYSNTRAGRDWI